MAAPAAKAPTGTPAPPARNRAPAAKGPMETPAPGAKAPTGTAAKGPTGTAVPPGPALGAMAPPAMVTTRSRPTPHGPTMTTTATADGDGDGDGYGDSAGDVAQEQPIPVAPGLSGRPTLTLNPPTSLSLGSFRRRSLSLGPLLHGAASMTAPAAPSPSAAALSSTAPDRGRRRGSLSLGGSLSFGGGYLSLSGGYLSLDGSLSLGGGSVSLDDDRRGSLSLGGSLSLDGRLRLPLPSLAAPSPLLGVCVAPAPSLAADRPGRAGGHRRA
ncbi:hypothetical protein EJB05_37435, partial [Eragrostis curvula]